MTSSHLGVLPTLLTLSHPLILSGLVSSVSSPTLLTDALSPQPYMANKGQTLQISLKFIDHLPTSSMKYTNIDFHDLIFHCSYHPIGDVDKPNKNFASLGSHISLIALTVFLSFGVSLTARLAEIELDIHRGAVSCGDCCVYLVP